MKSYEKIILAFIGGAAVGLTLGLLFAPEKGKETRKRITETLKKCSSDAEDKLSSLQDCAESVIEKINNVFKETKVSENENDKTFA